MATLLKGVFVSCLLLLILMEEAKPVLAKKPSLKQRVKKLEGSIQKVDKRLKELEKCQACKKIKVLNDEINKLKEVVGPKPDFADCGDPGVPVHGSKSGQSYLAGGMVTFTCDAGYHLEGPAKAVCLENGNWNNALPKCRRMCNEPAPPENGYLIGSEFWEGKNVTYKCNEGHELQGLTVRVCEESGEWTGKEPACEPEYVSAVAGLEDSAILKNNASYLEVLGGFLKHVVQSGSHWKRCWQASQDGWERATFLSNCADKRPTVVIIRAEQYIFGGYTSLSWSGPECGYQYDSAAFVYSLVNYPGWQPMKFDQKGQSGSERKHSIQTCVLPTFGTGHDIAISARAAEQTQSSAYLGNTYGPLHGHSPTSSFAKSFLAGRSPFRPDEVEVFYETT